MLKPPEVTVIIENKLQTCVTELSLAWQTGDLKHVKKQTKLIKSYVKSIEDLVKHQLFQAL